MQTDWFSSVRQQTVAARSADDLTRVFRRLCEDFDLPYYVMALRSATSFVDPELMVMDGYPAPFREIYTALDGLRSDPVLLQCYEQAAPVFWDEAFAVAEPETAGSRYVEAVREIGLRAGITTGCRGMRGHFVILSFGTDRENRELQDHLRAIAPHVMIANTLVHDAVSRLVVDNPARTLTPRERECLLWCAEGKTARQTGEILDITERTVTFHLRNVAAKLGVSSRQQAVARAVSLGIIDPRPVTMPPE